jgi:membrane fusion protein
VGCVTAILVFACFAQYSRKETAVGYLTPTVGTAKIFALQRGTIKEVHVQEGDSVRAGQPLITVETNSIAENGTDINASMLETLKSQSELIADNISAEEQRTVSERERLSSLIHGLEGEIAQLENQLQTQAERLRITESEVGAAEHLRSKGFMTEVEFRRRQLQMLEHKQAVGALKQQLASRQNQLTETRFALGQLPTVMAQKVQALRNDLAAAEQRIAEINGRRAYVLRAPQGRTGLYLASDRWSERRSPTPTARDHSG